MINRTPVTVELPDVRGASREIAVMAYIDAAISQQLVDVNARARVAQWLFAKYGEFVTVKD